METEKGLRIIVQDSVDAYQIPNWYPVKVEKIIDWEDALTYDELEQKLSQLDAKWLNFDLDVNSSYYLIEFPDTILLKKEKLIQRYLFGFMGYLLELWAKRGADDDYFDYLPSITDVFYQLAHEFSLEIWDKFIGLLIEFEGSKVKTESLYRY